MNILHKTISALGKSLLGLLGIAVYGCDGIGRGMYGCPFSDFEVKGQVVNEAQEPLEGIVVTPTPEYFESGKITIDDIGEGGYEAVTDKDGKFTIKIQTTGFPDSLFVVDVDGAENGGDFKTSGAKVEMRPTTPSKQYEDNDWYEGAFIDDDVNFVMEHKEEKTEGQ